MASITSNIVRATTFGLLSMNKLDSYGYQHKKVNLKFRNARYPSVASFAARRYAVQVAYNAVNQILPNMIKARQRAAMAARSIEVQGKVQQLIQDQNTVNDAWGKLACQVDGGGVQNFIARDRWGRKISEALFVAYESEDPYSITSDGWLSEAEHSQLAGDSLNYPSVLTTTVFHCDVNPEISVSSGNNVICTQVAGRDFSRKEFVAGEDINFTVKGAIVSHEAGVYPQDSVQRFINIMQHNGLLNVNNFYFGLLGVDQVVIKDWSLPSQEYKNIQPYQFTCVAVEPYDILVQDDNISSIDTGSVYLSEDTWLQSILNSKLGTMVQNSTTMAAMSLTDMVTNI